MSRTDPGYTCYKQSRGPFRAAVFPPGDNSTWSARPSKAFSYTPSALFKIGRATVSITTVKLSSTGPALYLSNQGSSHFPDVTVGVLLESAAAFLVIHNKHCLPSVQHSEFLQRLLKSFVLQEHVLFVSTDNVKAR